MFKRLGSPSQRSQSKQSPPIDGVQPQKPLLYIPEPGQVPRNLQAIFDAAIQDGAAEEFSRAEIGLRRAVASLSSLTGGALNSLTMTTALNLPGMTPATIWMADFLFEPGGSKGDIERFIHKRNQDSRMLLQSLSQVDLSSWQTSLVEEVNYDAIPSELNFPPGYPIPGKIYRQHPLQSKHHSYYPAASYYSVLLEERETELIQILSDLGAIKITVQALAAGETGSDTVGSEQVFEYPGEPWSSNMSFDPSKYSWVEYEPTWLRVIESRIRHRCLSTSFELSIDISNTLADQFEGIRGLAKQLHSIHPEEVERALNQTLQKRKVSVQFA